MGTGRGQVSAPIRAAARAELNRQSEMPERRAHSNKNASPGDLSRSEIRFLASDVFAIFPAEKQIAG
jgi:hypothetical protein